MPQRVLQFHQLNEDVVFRIETGSSLWRFEVEREPLLHAVQPAARREIEDQSEVEHDWRGENGVAAEEVDLDLHRVAERAENVNVVPALVVVTARRVIVDADDV